MASGRTLGPRLVSRHIIDILQERRNPLVSLAVAVGAKHVPDQAGRVLSLRLEDEKSVSVLAFCFITALPGRVRRRLLADLSVVELNAAQVCPSGSFEISKVGSMQHEEPFFPSAKILPAFGQISFFSWSAVWPDRQTRLAIARACREDTLATAGLNDVR